MKYRAKIIVKLKDKIKDSKGDAVNSVLKRIALEEEANVRIGKFFELEVSAKTTDGANFKLQNIIKDVLVNPVVETYEILEFKPVENIIDTVTSKNEVSVQ